MIRSFRYHLFLNQQELAGLDEIRVKCQRLYNAALEQRISAYRKQEKTVSRYEQHKELTELRQSDPEGYGSIAAVILRSPLNRLDRAYKAFFRRIKQGQRPGFPRFRSRDRYDSFSFPNPVLKGDLLTVPSFGTVRLKLYRPLKGKPLEAHIRKTCRGWEASVVCDLGAAPEKLEIKIATGIDVGLTSFATFSDGSEVENPRFFRRSEALLAKHQKALASKKKRRNSNSRKRSKLLVAKTHLHIRNQRLDFLRKLAKEIVSKYDLVAIEDLNIRGMVRTLNFGKSVSDASWGLFAACLSNKAEEAGKTIVAVDPRGTSQNCSGCGKRVVKLLSERQHRCPHCGLSLGRDHNAALNIHALGLSAVSRTGAKAPMLAEAS